MPIKPNASAAELAAQLEKEKKAREVGAQGVFFTTPALGQRELLLHPKTGHNSATILSTGTAAVRTCSLFRLANSVVNACAELRLLH